MGARKILFIGHEGSRTGAPIVLLTLIRWLRESTDWTLGVVLGRNGELASEYARYAELATPESLQAAGNSPSMLQRFEPDLFYFNSVASIPAFQCTPAPQQRLLCHVHELEHVIRMALGFGSTSAAFGQFDRFIACADAVRQNLVSRHGVAPEKVEVIHECIHAAGLVARSANRAMHAQWLRNSLKIPSDAFVIGFVGAPEWRKGSDLAVHLARQIGKELSGRPVHFIYLGLGPLSLERHQIEFDLERMGSLATRFKLVSPQADPVPYFSGIDVLAHLSREDPFPLVCLESAVCGTPVAYFEGAGGIGEVLKPDCALAAPYLDMPAMAIGISELLLNPARRAQLAELASQRVRSACDMSVAGPRVVAAIEQTLSSPSRRHYQAGH